MAGLGAAAVVLMLCFGFYKRLKKSSLDENQSPTKQKLTILLRIGLFWGFWWIVGGLLILFLMMNFELDAFIDITKTSITTLGWIIIPGYVFYCGYQLFYNKKTINDFNKKAIQAIKEEEEESVFVNIFSFVVVLIIIGFGFYYYNKKNIKGELEMFNYSDTPKSTIDDLKYPYEDEETWIKEGIPCQSLEDEQKIQYCLETKEACSEFIPEKNTNMRPFSICVSKVREMLGIPPSKKLDIFGNKITNTEDNKVNWGTLYDKPFSNFETIEKRWGTMTYEKKLKVVRNIFATGTTYDQFPDWLKNDPVVKEIKEELQKTDTNQ